MLRGALTRQWHVRLACGEAAAAAVAAPQPAVHAAQRQPSAHMCVQQLAAAAGA